MQTTTTETNAPSRSREEFSERADVTKASRELLAALHPSGIEDERWHTLVDTIGDIELALADLEIETGKRISGDRVKAIFEQLAWAAEGTH